MAKSKKQRALENDYANMTDEQLNDIKNHIFSGDPNTPVTVGELYGIFEWLGRVDLKPKSKTQKSNRLA